VVSNLLSNAIKFTKEGIVTITVEKEEEHNNLILVSIKDSRQGIDSEIVPRLFSKFDTKS
jgi:signal transduction histidine kinase